MKRDITIILWLLCANVATTSAQAQEQRFEVVTDDLKVERLTDDVWRYVSYAEVEGFGRTPGNGLIVVSGESAALIDTPWNEELTRDLFHWAREHLSAKITVVVATHSHQDCTGGLDAAHRLGARSYGSKKTAKLARRGGRPVPRTTFKRTLDVEVGSRTLKLHAAGPGHTVDTIVVWIPDDEVLFGGCLVRSASSTQLGYIQEADLKRWPRTIETLLDAYGDARWIVPGHGSPGDAELLHNTLKLLAAHE